MNDPLIRSDDPRQPPSARAYAYIRERIVTGDWPGGSRLFPEKIANMLSISRMPVRDAMRQLDAEGLVTMRPNQAALVALLPPEELYELYEIRAALEGMAARKATPCITEASLAELRALADQLIRNELDVQRWTYFHDRFHDFVCEIAGQRHLLREIQRIRTAMQPCLPIFIGAYREKEMVGDEHARLIDALASGNPALAEQMFSHHILTAGREAAAFIGKQIPS